MGNLIIVCKAVPIGILKGGVGGKFIFLSVGETLCVGVFIGNVWVINVKAVLDAKVKGKSAALLCLCGVGLCRLAEVIGAGKPWCARVL